MSRSLRLAAAVEAVTYLVLLVSVVAARTGGPDVVGVAGVVHGVVFLAYAALVLRAGRAWGWTPYPVVVLLAAAFVPGGTILAERWARTGGAPFPAPG